MQVWACRSCGSVQRIAGICSEHGWLEGLVAGAGKVSAYVVCPLCSQTIRSEEGHSLEPVELLPECSCGSTRSWVAVGELPKPDLSYQPGPDGEQSWIMGEFEGELLGLQGLDGPLAGVPGTHLEGFKWRIAEGRLQQLCSVDGPPTEITPQEAHFPLRQNVVTPVIVGKTIRGELVSIELHDFRLHHWEVIEPGLTAGIRGLAYGRVKRTHQEAQRPEPAVSDQTTDTPQTQPDPHLSSSDDCGICAKTVQLVLAGLAGWRCGLAAGLTDLATMMLMCWLSRVLGRLADSLSAKWRRWRDRSLVAMSLAGLLIYFYLGWCGLAPLWPLIFPVIALLGGAWSRSCAVKTTLVLLLQVASWASCSTGFCAPDNGSGVMGRVSDLVQGTVQDLLHQTPIGQAQEQARLSGEREPISITEAVRNPEALDDCRTPIRFESGMLFDFDKSDLRSRNEADLFQLLQLTQLERFKDRSFVITGHADRVGDDSLEGKLHNKRLSLERARAVEVWLRQRGSYREGQLQAVGAGTWLPINPDIRFTYLNRRVEVRLACPADPAS